MILTWFMAIEVRCAVASGSVWNTQIVEWSSEALSDDIFSWGIQIFVCEAFLQAFQHEALVSFSFLFFTDR